MKAVKVISLSLMALCAYFAFSEIVWAGQKIPPKTGNFDMGAYAGLTVLIWLMGLGVNWVLLGSFPNRTDRLTTLFEKSPWKSLLIGLVNLFVLTLIVFALLENVHPVGAAFSLIVLIVLFIGLHGRSRALGRKILRAAKHEPSAFAEVTVGWSAVAFLCALPFIGWTVIAIFYFAGGLGAVTLSFFSKRSTGGGADLDSHVL